SALAAGLTLRRALIGLGLLALASCCLFACLVTTFRRGIDGAFDKGAERIATRALPAPQAPRQEAETGDRFFDTNQAGEVPYDEEKALPPVGKELPAPDGAPPPGALALGDVATAQPESAPAEPAPQRAAKPKAEAEA